MFPFDFSAISICVSVLLLVSIIIIFILTCLHVHIDSTVLTPCLQRTAGSSSDGTADSDDSGDHEKTDSSHSEANQRNNTRLTRASLRLSQSSQGIHTQLIIHWCLIQYDPVYGLSNLSANMVRIQQMDSGVVGLK